MISPYLKAINSDNFKNFFIKKFHFDLFHSSPSGLMIILLLDFFKKGKKMAPETPRMSV